VGSAIEWWRADPPSRRSAHARRLFKAPTRVLQSVLASNLAADRWGVPSGTGWRFAQSYKHGAAGADASFWKPDLTYHGEDAVSGSATIRSLEA
jgi:hypothetical protein